MPVKPADAVQPEAHHRAVALFEQKSIATDVMLDEARADRDSWREQAQRFYVKDHSQWAWWQLWRP
jgi:hypothetical protein